MANDDILGELRKLQGQLPEPQDAHGLIMLLGNGLAEAMVGMRAQQAALELARAEARGSVHTNVRRAEAEASIAALAAVEAEVRRLRIEQPHSGDGIIGIYGHVLDDGEPVVGAEVALVGGEKPLACIDTDKAGAFVLSVDSDGPLALRVSIADQVVHRDTELTIVPSSVAAYRLVELGEATPDPPTQRPCDDVNKGNGRPKPTQPLPKPGGSLNEVLKDLKGKDMPVVALRLFASKNATPRVVDIRAADAGVELDVQGQLSDAGRLAVVASLVAHQPKAEKAGIGSATAAAELLKTGKVTSWEEAVRAPNLTEVGISRRFGLDRDQATALRSALATTIATIEIMEEE